MSEKPHPGTKPRPPEGERASAPGANRRFLLVPGRAPPGFVLLSLIALWPTGGPL